MGSASVGMEGRLYSLFSIILVKETWASMDTHAPPTGGPEAIPGGNRGTTVGAKAPGGDNVQSQVSSLITLKNTSGKSSHYPAMLLGPPCAVMNTMGKAVGKRVLKNWWLP